MNNDISTITFCKRINKLILGFDLVKLGIQENSVHVVVLAKDLSDKTIKEVLFLCDKYTVPYKKVDISMTELEYIIGKRVGVMAITEESFAKKLLSTIDE